MAELEDTKGSEGAATKVIILLLGFAALFALVSIVVITLISHNVYVASYYTISSLFDANGEGASAFLTALISSAGTHSGVFYTFIAISLIDGMAKVVIIGFLIAAFINLLAGIDIKSKLDVITAKRQRGHVIICGYSMLAERLCTDFKKDGIRFVLIDKDPEKVNMLRDLGFNVVEGDFTERNILEISSLKNAKAIIFATESDFVNLLGIVTAHHMYPDVKIIARARHVVSVTKMQRAGAELCLVPEAVAGLELGEHIMKL